MRCHRLVRLIQVALMFLASTLAIAESRSRTEPDTGAVTALETVSQATNGSRVEPTAAGFVNAVQIFGFNPTELYRVYTKPGRVTDIALQPGEELVDISGADPIRWIVGNTTSGKGESQRRHISIKPTRADLATNLIIYTDRRTYYIEVMATAATWMTGVAWEYPGSEPRSNAAPPLKHEEEGERPSVERLEFGYDIVGPRVAWRPLRIFDDGAKVYIQFPADIAQHDLPPLFLVDGNGKTQLVNYRFRTPYYIVDRLFAAAELRLGDRKSQVVRIKRVKP